MSKEILMPHGSRKKLAYALGTSEVTVHSALHFVTSSNFSEKIRQTAIKEFGGVLINR